MSYCVENCKLWGNSHGSYHCVVKSKGRCRKDDIGICAGPVSYTHLPVVIASGYGTVAEHIIDIAEKKGIPVFKDDSAASLLCMREVGSNIPVELYEVVAAIYGKLSETSASIRGVEAAAAAAAMPARGKENAAGGRIRRNLASGKKKEEPAK